MKLTRISTEHYNGQSPCQRCNPSGSYSGYRNWSCMMVEFKEIEGHYCHKCAKEIEEEYMKEGDENADSN